MASGRNNNHRKTNQLNLNEMYNGKIWYQPSIQLFEQTPGLKQSATFPHNMNNEYETQSGEDVKIDVVGELVRIISNQQRYRRVFEVLWKIGRPNDGPTTRFMKCVTCQDMCVDSKWEIMYRMQEFTKPIVKVYEKNVDHKDSVARWEVVFFLNV